MLYSRLVTLAMVMVVLSGCATRSSDAEPPMGAEADPFEPWNRKVFAFNEFVDKYAARPAARGYRKVTPGWLDDTVTRVFENLSDLRSSANDVLQWEWSGAAQNFGRFTLNTTLGVAGLFDVATDVGLDKSDEDFGLTLADWGVARGPYLVLPFMGPSTVRAAAGRVPDYYLWGPNYIDHELTEYSVDALYILDKRADLLDFERAVVGDRYSFLRRTYLQSRFYKSDGERAPQDDFGEGFESSDDDW